MGQAASRRFEFNDGKSSKFWEIEVAGTEFTVRYGKIGKAGQSQVKEFADAAAASKVADKLIAEKAGKGYQELGGTAPPVSATADAAPPSPKKTAKAPKTLKAAAAPKPADLAKDPSADPSALEALAGSSEAIDRLLARNPMASAALLEQLSHSSDKTTRNYVVLHSNAPKDVLAKLAHQFPADFFRNPAFDWLLIEDPDLMQRIGGNVLGTLLKRPDCPQSFLNWAVKHGTEKERMAVAMNPEASVEALRELVSQGGAVAEAARAHKMIGVKAPGEDPLAVLEAEVRTGLTKLSVKDTEAAWKKGLIGPAQWKWLNPEAKLEVASISNLARPFQREVVVLRAIAQIGHVDIDFKIVRFAPFSLAKFTPASDPDSPAELLEKLASGPDKKVRWDVAGNPRASVKALTILAADESEQMRGAIAGHPLCSPALLEQLAVDPDSSVRSVVATHLLCSEALLQKLAADPEPDVRAAVAGNHSCPQELFPELVTDKGASVRRAVAANPACPAQFLEVLAKQEGFGSVLAKNRACPPEIQRQAGVEIFFRAGRGPDVYALRYQPRPVDELRSLANSENVEIRLSVALNPACPPELLESLARDQNEVIAFEIARKPSCPPELRVTILENLSRSKDKDALLVVARWISTPEDLRIAAYSLLLKKLGPQGIKELDDEPLCPPSIRKVVRARIWRQQLQSLSKKYGTQVIVEKALGNLDDQQLTAVAEQVFSEDNPDSSLDQEAPPTLLSRTLRSDQAGSILAIPVESADNAARHSEFAIRLLGLHHTHTSPDILAKRSKSTEWQERLAIASNPSCPPNVREKLKNDPHRLVAAAARLGAERNKLVAARQTQTMAQTDTAALLVGEETDKTVTIPIELIAEVKQRIRQCSGRQLERARWRECDLLDSRWNRYLTLGQLHSVTNLEQMSWDFRLLPQSLKALELWWAKGTDEPYESSADFLEKHAKDKELLWTIAESPYSPQDALSELAQHRSHDIKVRIAQNTAAPPDVLQRLAKDKEPVIRERVAANPSTPPETLVLLAQDKDSVIVPKEVAKNPSSPQEALLILADAEFSEIRALVASISNTPISALSKLAREKGKLIREEVAGNPSTPFEVLTTLANDRESSVQRHAALNPSIPEQQRIEILAELNLAGDEDLFRMAKSRDPWVREELAGYPSLPHPILIMLAKDKDPEVRMKLAENPSTPGDTLALLLNDDDSREKAAAHPSMPVSALTELAKSKDARILGLVAINPSTPVEVLTDLAISDLREVRRAVAGNASTPSSALADLSCDMDEQVRRAVAENQATPLPVLENLTRDSNWLVSISAARHCKTPSVARIAVADDLSRHPFLRLIVASAANFPQKLGDALHKILAELESMLRAPDPLGDFSDDEFRMVFKALDLYPDPSDSKAIAKTAKSKDWLARYASTYVPSIQPNLLKLLLDDPEGAVKQRAIACLRAMELRMGRESSCSQDHAQYGQVQGSPGEPVV